MSLGRFFAPEQSLTNVAVQSEQVEEKICEVNGGDVIFDRILPT